MGLEQLNWLQRYSGEEVIEHYQHGRVSRRDMMRQLVVICGSASLATSLLAACGDDGNATTSATTNPASTAASPTTGAPATTAPAATTGATSTTARTGPALAVAPNDPAVQGSNVAFPGPAGNIAGYLARPAASGRRGGVIVIHENRGLTDHIRDVARRVAKAGFIGLAIDLASRAGGTEAAGGNIGAVLTGGTDADRVADIDAGLRYLESQSDYNGKVGITGFCFGGGITFLYAANQPKVVAAVPYYGVAPSTGTPLSSTKAAVLAHYGATDSRVNANIPAVETALAGKTFDKRVWDGAGHAFNNDTGGAYNEKVAVDAWTLTVDWFKKHLT